ncbi:MAG: hypothetical protein ACYS76_01725 [Planctomycetota bacterium]|jgi:hypothetical protein
MNKWFSGTLFLLVLMTGLVVTGCAQESKEEVAVRHPLVDPNVAVPNYVSAAIEASGGRQAWTRLKKLVFNCVVTFYRPDGSFYLTEQSHEVEPQSARIRISGREPEGELVWEFSPDGFSVLGGTARIEARSATLVNRYFAEAILDITTAPVRLLDVPAGPVRESRPVRMEGLWYYPIKLAGAGGTGVRSGLSEAVFFQNRASSLVDIVWLSDLDGEFFLAVRGYDYVKVKKGEVLVPAKIEIFRIDREGVVRQRVAKIDYYGIRSVE